MITGKYWRMLRASDWMNTGLNNEHKKLLFLDDLDDILQSCVFNNALNCVID